MKKLWINSLAAIVFAFALVACSDDDDSNPTNSGNNGTDTTTVGTDTTTIGTNAYAFWSMKTGTYWINNSYLVDSTGTPSGSSLLTDSTIVISNSTIDSKSAYTVNIFNSATGIKTSDGYSFAPTEDALYVTAEFITPFIEKIPMVADYLTIPNYGWLKIADKALASWEPLSEPIQIKDFPIDVAIENMVVDPITLNINVIISNNGTGTMTDPVTGKTINTLTYKIDYEITGTTTATYMSFVKLNPTLEGHYYSYITFAEGIGIVANYSPTQTFQLIATLPAPLNQSLDIYSQEISGTGTFLIRYKN